MKGIALCGGGSKGSYELGAWEAFKELNIEFDIVTGTSIGALNGGMIVQDEYQRCFDLWHRIKINDVILNGFEVADINIKSIINHSEFKPFIKQVFKEKGTDINPFKALLSEYLDCDKIRKSNKLFGVVMTTFPTLKIEEVLMNNLSDHDMYHTMLASASAFPVFPVCKFNNKQYIDGGFSDNLPISFAVKLGAREVYAIDLNPNITHKCYLNRPFIHYIYPKWDLGSFLYFDINHLRRNRILGYYDVMKHFGVYDGYRYIINKGYDKVNVSRYALIILNDFSFMKYNKLKNYIKKRDYKDIFCYLNKHISRQVADSDYYIKCVEEVAVIYGVDYTKVYELEELISLIFEKINQHICDIDINKEVLELNDSKKRDYINEFDKKKFINYIYNNRFDYNMKIFLMQSNIELYLAYVLIEGRNYEV